MDSYRSSRPPTVGIPHDVIVGRIGQPLSADVDVRFSSSNGESHVMPAFQSADGSVRARFAPRQEGTFEYVSISADATLDAIRGRVDVEPYDGANPLFVHGRLRVAADGWTLEHEDGKPFLWIGDTWWMGLGTRLRWPDEFNVLLEDRVGKGFSVVQIVAGPLPDFPATPDGTWHPDQANEGGWPWNPGWADLNAAFFDAADLKIDALVQAGIVPCIVGMWGWYLTLMGEERARRHWRNLVARYAAYPVVFCIAGEVNLPPRTSTDEREWRREQSEADAARARQLVGWAALANDVRQLDPFRNPVTAHPAHPDVRSLLGVGAGLDINMLQTSHWSYHTPSSALTDAIDALLGLARPIRLGFAGALELTAEAVAMRPRMPVINGEPCYEGIMGGNWQDVQRFLFWSGMTSGLAGFTYGANGIWQMNSAREPLSVPNAWGAGRWEEAMHYPGSRQVGLGRRLLEQVDWSRMTPVGGGSNPPGRLGRYASGIDGRQLYYLPSALLEERFHGMRGLSVNIPGDRPVQARFVDPRTLDTRPIGQARPASDGTWLPPAAPSMEDWILIIESDPARGEH